MLKPVIAVLILFCPTLAYAYIDPGTGTALVYVVTGIVVSLFFAARVIFYKLLEIISGRRIKQESCNVAIHSEDPRYETTFVPIMEHLAKQRTDFTYFTMYKRDATFPSLPEGAGHKEISDGIIGYAFLNKLKANLLITTTPQLDVMIFKRSKHVRHYCFVQHALGESLYMRPYPYDFFDTVMCCGDILAKNIRKIESIRKLKSKNLLKTGLPHYDVLLRQRKGTLPKKEKKTILIAPSWGKLSLFQNYGIDFVNDLRDKFHIIIRPHPQMRISQPELFEKITAIQGVEIDISPVLGEVISRADILLSDFSGIIHEFAFIHEKPVIVADYEKNFDAFEGYLLQSKSEIAEQCKDFIITIKPEAFQDLEEVIERTIRDFSVARVREVRERLIYNFGNAAETVAAQIAEILKCV